MTPRRAAAPGRTGAGGNGSIADGESDSIILELDRVDPDHLEELASVIRQRQWERAGRMAELLDRPALGAYRRKLREAP